MYILYCLLASKIMPTIYFEKHILSVVWGVFDQFEELVYQLFTHKSK